MTGAAIATALVVLALIVVAAGTVIRIRGLFREDREPPPSLTGKCGRIGCDCMKD